MNKAKAPEDQPVTQRGRITYNAPFEKLARDPEHLAAGSLHRARSALESVWYFWYMADLGSATSDNVRGLKAWVSTMFLELGVAGGLHVWAQIAFGLAPPTREKAAVAIAAVMWFNRSLMYPAGWAPMLARFVALPNERRRKLRILGGIISAAVIAWWLVAVGVLRNWN